MGKLEGKKVFITGATSGIGKSCAMKFADEKARLILMIRNEEKGKKLVEEINEKYPETEVTLLIGDVRDGKVCEELVNSLPEELKDIDVLVNNAGLAKGLNKVYENSIEDINTMVDTNIKGLLFVTRAVVPLMVKYNKGHIINLGSVAGVNAYAGGGVYCATKAAVKFISDALRLELIETPVKVTNIQPGIVETDFSLTRFNGDVEKAKNVYKGIEALTPDDIADIIISTASYPDRVQISEVTIVAQNQADSRSIFKR
ncbi:MAG: SDR family NAD(P)-dependent oxidoreductase [Fusobacterium perfoetens]|uniref:SDR family NAD(P)-dependent oxidoreductase n=1 Tax=Fusobacterium perfoetens TaxID=852 RepID=UPI0023F3D372|nr:SDR family NAD(P)-dependent oxidoreductase [Fusobacterium perfoetens]MCI6151632.1 SDR family NAD(P)-dependent oxidoreductase [Fusobacterium perfoetens]MDY3237800.1 SDR family NAD(P)-dependent oxidoreductase [Fusobacterium perfoetens]